MMPVRFLQETLRNFAGRGQRARPGADVSCHDPHVYRYALV